MNSLDILSIILLIGGAYSGFDKGFIATLVVLILYLFGFIKGVPLFHTLLPILEAENKIHFLMPFLPIFLTIIMTAIANSLIFLITKLIKGIVTITLLGIFDRLLGALFGCLQAVFVISLLVYFYNCFKLSFLSEWIHSSKLIPIIEPIVPKLLQLFMSNHFRCPYATA